MDLSIVVPTYNRKSSLKKCLLSLEHQDYPKDNYEIIVVDDGSPDDIQNMVDSLMREHKNIRYIHQHNKGPAAARNSGIKESRGSIVGFVDDDCVVDEGWVRLMINAHQNNSGAIAVGGLTSPSIVKTSVLVSQFLSTCSIETYVNGKKEVIFFPTCNVSFKKALFFKYKFNENFPLPGGEDLEFFWQLFKDGYRFIWNKNIKVAHHRRRALINFARQAYIYGRGNLLTQYIHKDHPLLKELKTGKISFWIYTFVNIMKIPRFIFYLGNRLIKEDNIAKIRKKISVYSYFGLHKVFYILGNISEYLRLKRNGFNKKRSLSYVPSILILDITHSCNLNCRICDIWKTKDSEQDINILHIKRVLLEAKHLGIREVALSGGEPLLRKDIFEILDYARKTNVKNLGVLTNGILVAKYIDRLETFLIDNTISLVISLDSLRSDVHNHIRNSDVAWQETVESLKKLSLLKEKYPQIDFSVIAIILNQNLEELLDLAVFVRSLGVSSLQFQALLPNNLIMAQRKKSSFWIPKEKLSLLDETIDKLIRFKIDNPQFIKNSIKNLSLVKKYYRRTINSDDVRCISAYKTVLVSNQGESRTCLSLYGNIKKQSLEEIINSREIIKARKKVKKCSRPCLLPCFCDVG